MTLVQLDDEVHIYRYKVRHRKGRQKAAMNSEKGGGGFYATAGAATDAATSGALTAAGASAVTLSR